MIDLAESSDSSLTHGARVRAKCLTCRARKVGGLAGGRPPGRLSRPQAQDHVQIQCDGDTPVCRRCYQGGFECLQSKDVEVISPVVALDSHSKERTTLACLPCRTRKVGRDLAGVRSEVEVLADTYSHCGRSAALVLEGTILTPRVRGARDCFWNVPGLPGGNAHGDNRNRRDEIHRLHWSPPLPPMFVWPHQALNRKTGRVRSPINWRWR